MARLMRTFKRLRPISSPPLRLNLCECDTTSSTRKSTLRLKKVPRSKCSSCTTRRVLTMRRRGFQMPSIVTRTCSASLKLKCEACRRCLSMAARKAKVIKRLAGVAAVETRRSASCFLTLATSRLALCITWMMSLRRWMKGKSTLMTLTMKL